MESSDLALLAALDALLQESSVTGAARRVGLSTPAMSHTLARIRERFADPILVRAGRRMVLTPRAEGLKERVRRLVSGAEEVLAPERPFVVRELDRSFVVLVTDYVLTVLGEVLDRILREEAPGIAVRFVPNTPDDAQALRDGTADMAVGIYGDLPQEMRARQLVTDRFVCVVREQNPFVGKRMTSKDYVRLSHLQIAPRGKVGGYVDDVLREHGLERRVSRAVPFFMTALGLVARTDYVLTVSERVARLHAPALGLRILEPPIALEPYALSLVWHPRSDADLGHRWFREALVRAAKLTAGDTHPAPRRRLDRSDPTSGQTRRRPRKRSQRPR